MTDALSSTAPPLTGSPSQDGKPLPVSPANSGDPAPNSAISDDTKERLDKILHSEIGVETLLARLKQSVGSARDFATYLKKRSALEEDNAQGLKKLARMNQENISRPGSRHGTYSRAVEELNRIQERMADHGLQFAVSLYQMSEDLLELADNIDKGRKHWKHAGMSAEKRVQDAESQAEKAKAKYDALAEQYDRVKTGDKQGGKFGLKGHKSAVQVEEELNRKVQAADSDYKSKVQAAKAARQELVSVHRPQAVHNLKQLIYECDSGLTLQLQKYASFNERHLLGKGLCISPLRDGPSGPKSLREVIHEIDSERDFNEYILSFEGAKGSVAAPEVEYHRHPTLAPPPSSGPPPSTMPTTPSSAPPPTAQSGFSTRLPGPGSSPGASQPSLPPVPTTSDSMQSGAPSLPPIPSYQQPTDGYSSSGGYKPYQPYQPYQPQQRPQSPQSQQPPYPTEPPVLQPYNLGPPSSPGQRPLSVVNETQSSLPPLNPVFGVSLEELYQRDGTAVPIIVYQCIQAVEMFGLDVEGIYRQSGSANHINHMKALFDNDSSKVDFTNPENFFHDVNSVAGLLKQFFRELPDPLFTRQYYSDFINAARIDNAIQRRDSLHAIINGLPDPNYATLRALILHLNRVQEHSANNRMNAGNLAICFGPTLMGGNAMGNLADAGWQHRVIETVLQNTFQIFDDD
ncbi:hypothetical protein VTN49DRAFT_1688 [Thermomyces lanuginosus]|uniref:uncharacterized protein n=1 Tax=Thermomyces lanuginosus TaxID=5541 RepID=UPI0037431232